MRRALVPIAVIVGAVGFLAWVIAAALELPIVSWFVYALWGAIAVGLVARAFRRPRDAASVPIEAADQVQNLYLGRKLPTMYPNDPAASSQYGDAPPPDPLNLPESSEPATARRAVCTAPPTSP